jgi:hypothetical protein
MMSGTVPSAFALDGESIVFNPVTGNYLITYLNSTDDSFRQVIFIPATKINPTLKSELNVEQVGSVQYSYTLMSGRDSQQDIVSFLLDPVSSVTSSLPDIPLNAPPGKIMDDMADVASFFETPAPWEAFMGYSDGQMAFRVGWGTKVANGFRPGSKAVFGFKSRDLPGIIKVEIHGYAPGSKYIPSGEADPEDGGFGQQYTELVTKNNFVPRYAAAPAIALPSPFNAGLTLERIQTQMHTWIGMGLLNSTFSSQLDRYFQSAISAYRLSQPKVGKKHIQTMRELVHKEYPDMGRDEEHESEKSQGKDDEKKSAMIARLAARVLDFDLKYVMQRTGDGN